MSKYEIMIIVNGSKQEPDADAVSLKCQKLLKDAKELKETKMGLRKLAYPIKKVSHGYYYVFNFLLDDPEVIKNFNRLALINKDILRHLIINVEHNYGYRAINNKKKIERSKKAAEIYAARQKWLEKLNAERAEQKEENEKINEKEIKETIKKEIKSE